MLCISAKILAQPHVQTSEIVGAVLLYGQDNQSRGHLPPSNSYHGKLPGAPVLILQKTFKHVLMAGFYPYPAIRMND